MLDSFWDGVKRLFSEPIPERVLDDFWSTETMDDRCRLIHSEVLGEPVPDYDELVDQKSATVMLFASTADIFDVDRAKFAGALVSFRDDNLDGALRRLETIIHASNSPSAANAKAEAYTDLAFVYEFDERLEEMAQALRHAVDCFEISGERERKADTLFELSEIYQKQDLRVDSAKACDEAVELIRDILPDDVLAGALYDKAFAYLFGYGPDQAMEVFDERHRLLQKGGDEELISSSFRWRVAIFLFFSQDYDVIEPVLQEWLAFEEARDNMLNTARCYCYFAQIEEGRGNREASIRYRNQARSLFEELGEIELAEQEAKLLEEAQATTA